MPATGYIQVRAYESYALIPLQNAAITVTAPDGTAIAMRLTDKNGRITPIESPVPDRAESQSPGSAELPFAEVTLTARLRGYELIRIDRLQVFADTVTDQNLEMIPLSELPNAYDKSESFDTPPQNL